MRKIKFLSIVVIIIMTCIYIYSCDKKENVVTKETNFNLVAPSGITIAQNMDELNKKTAKVILGTYGNNREFKISSIDYLPLKEGYAALITYSLTDGSISNYALSSGTTFQIAPSSSLKSVREYSSTLSQQVTVKCSGTCGCRVEGTIDENTGKITFGCSCTDCTATITF